MPPGPVQAYFVETIQPLRSLMSALRRSSDLLQDARTLLLPRLVTGKVDISCFDLDALLEEAPIA